jgi:tetratricopeptide (TPR) repeat protein
MRKLFFSAVIGMALAGQAQVMPSASAAPAPMSSAASRALLADLDRSLKALKENKPQQVIKLLAPWIKDRPQDLRVAHLYAYALSQTGRLEEAKSTLEEALSGNEESALAFINLREILAQQAAVSYAKALGRPVPRQQPNLALTPEDLLPPAPEPEPELAAKTPVLDLSTVDLSAFGKEIRLRPRRGQEPEPSAPSAPSASSAQLTPQGSAVSSVPSSVSSPPPLSTASGGSPSVTPPPFPPTPDLAQTQGSAARAATAARATPAAPDRTATPEIIDPREEGKKVADLTRQWARVWAAKDFDAYVAFYSENFEPQQHPTRDDWMEYRKPRVVRPGKVVIEITDLKVRPLSEGYLEVRFRQRYDASNLKTNASRFLIWAREESGWKIIREEGR